MTVSKRDSASSLFQIRNMPRELRHAIHVAAALENVKIYEYCIKALGSAVRKSGVVIDNKENDNGKA